ncbi:hypothetical protein H7691_12540 [Stenotrophomonas sp. CW117]|uniref:hypothetical protein n=1 Tax=Stenotrophomonas TaxID=40323 RepID=UPI00070302C2|nr:MULTISPECIES: hypothetical protein [Stenotrophomonas]KRG86158.1 hypothetical protein ABB33_05045 [Stenotrophomonas acidaminiphila]QOF97464.1 hypothetical protein H7691_12540 [Stenotrophomonas sp. CW117]
MDETEARMQQAMITTFMACAVRALMASHPNPKALREAWNREVAGVWATASTKFAGPNPAADAMREIQDAWERHIPVSPT